MNALLYLPEEEKTFTVKEIDFDDKYILLYEYEIREYLGIHQLFHTGKTWEKYNKFCTKYAGGSRSTAGVTVLFVNCNPAENLTIFFNSEEKKNA